MPIGGLILRWRHRSESQLAYPFFADLVVLARGLIPFPYRTRPLNSSAPMVLRLKAWKSRSLPGLPRTDVSRNHDARLLRGAKPRLENGRPRGRPFCIAAEGSRT